MSHPAPRRPHPILKRDTSPFRSPVLPFTTASGPFFSPHVHFPPTPGMAATYPAHSPTTYDRKPIVVSPNVVQLPRRGDRKLDSPPADFESERRGRTRVRCSKGHDPDGGRSAAIKGSYFHPRAYEACKLEPSLPSTLPSTFQHPRMPALVQDLSPSDDSDDSVLTPPGSTTLPSPGQHASIGPPIPLHLPEPALAQRSLLGAHCSSDSSAYPPPSTSLSPPPRRVSNGTGNVRRPKLVRGERRASGKRKSGSFSPDHDEGCLGGF